MILGRKKTKVEQSILTCFFNNKLNVRYKYEIFGKNQHTENKGTQSTTQNITWKL
jgi:hypothetical protein